MEGQAISSSVPPNVLKMLQLMDKVIAEQTDLRFKSKLDPDGRISYPCKVKDVFDEEAQEFISQYLRLGSKRAWLETTCLVTFNMNGKKKEMVLYASKDKRSSIKYDSFPFKEEFDLDWRLCLNKKRDREQPPPNNQTPDQKKMCIETISPIFKQIIQDRYQTSNPQRIAEIALDVGKDIAKDYLLTDGLNVTLSQVLDSFGLMRHYITTSLSKTIQKAIRNREVYVKTVQRDPSIRANQIRAMNTAFIKNVIEALSPRNLTM
jgi:hypothetical protein